MNDDTHDDVEADIKAFTLLAAQRGHDLDDLDHFECCPNQLVTITLELPGGWGTAAAPLAAAMDVLDRLERDGIRPSRTTVEITDTPTT